MANLNDKPGTSERLEVLTQEEGAKKLEEIFSDLLPWAIESKDDATLLRENTIQNRNDIGTFLKSIYLCHIGEISVSVDDQDIADLIYKRHQAAVVAAYQSGHTLTTIISGERRYY